ncbi:MAG: nitroreductase family protein [Tissierellia bacterium]|nr:nitroreductase family protein [Tissierellia bacterium]
MISETMKKQREHRTIREFTEAPVAPALLRELLETINRTATSVGMQNFSIIRVTEEELRSAISEVCKQEYVTRVPELFIFIVDAYRNARLIEESGEFPDSRRDMDRFFQGFTDAVLAAQNLTVAVESLGMGAVYFGSILNDPAKIVELLGLPELTFPVLGVGFGVPNQDPQHKPRIPIEDKVFENAYEIYDSYTDRLADYNQEMKTYYDLRDANRKSQTYLEAIRRIYYRDEPHRANILRVVEQQGFLLYR